LEVFSVVYIFFKTEDGPLLEVDRLANNLAQNVGVIEHLLTSRPWKVLAARKSTDGQD
jgi:hypothetical protein